MSGGVQGSLTPSQLGISSQPQAPAPTPSTGGKVGDSTLTASPPDKSVGHLATVGHPSVPPSAPTLSATLVSPFAKQLSSKALPTPEQLKATIGKEPHADKMLFGKVIYKMSVHYKAVLSDLSAYNKQVGESTSYGKTGSLERSAKEQVRTLHSKLERLDESLAAYDASRRTGHKAEMRELRAQVAEERELLNALERDLSGGMPEGLEVKTALAYRHVDAGLSLERIHELQEQGISPDDLVAMSKVGLPPTADGLSALKHLQNFPSLTPPQAFVAAIHGLSREQVAAYVDAKIPINEATASIGVKREGDLQVLGSGATATVWKAPYEFSDGTHATGVFKAETTEIPNFAQDLGVDEKAPNWSGRAVATSNLDQHLQLGIVPKTVFAIEGGKLGTVMVMAKGSSPLKDGDFSIALKPEHAATLRDDPKMLEDLGKSHGWKSVSLSGDELQVKNTVDQGEGGVKKNDTVIKFDMSDPSIRKDLTKLQWLDGLTGQLDRHAHNYFVYKGDDGLNHVSAIDNDGAFGKKTLDPNDICTTHKNAKHHGISLERAKPGVAHGAMLPNVIDRATRDALMKMTPGDIDKEVGGLVTAEELAATKSRLAIIQDKIRQLDSDGGVLDTLEEWSSDSTSTRLGITSLDAAEKRAAADTSRKSPELKRDNAYAIELKLANATSYVAREAFMIEQVKANLTHYASMLPGEFS